jgi:endogenous inhibitor of DNA gyrase (YacG/DUF329 family)
MIAGSWWVTVTRPSLVAIFAGFFYGGASAIVWGVMSFTCPTCQRVLEGTFQEVRKDVPTLPFCSPRCRAADLGSWLNETYRIGAPVSEEDLDEGLPSGMRGPRPDETS